MHDPRLTYVGFAARRARSGLTRSICTAIDCFVLRAHIAIVAGCLFALLGCGRAPEHSKLIVLGIDGLDPVTTDLLMSEGKLPNFARLRQEGAYGRLKSMEPMLSP